MKAVIEINRREGISKIVLGGETQVAGTADDVLCWLAGWSRTGSVEVDVVMAEPRDSERLAGIYREAAMARKAASQG